MITCLRNNTSKSKKMRIGTTNTLVGTPLLLMTIGGEMTMTGERVSTSGGGMKT